MKNYYDHDHIWQTRSASKKPVWGSNSFRVYDKVVTLVSEEGVSVDTHLDVGCGAGAFGLRAVKLGWSYTGVDASATAVELGQKAYSGFTLLCEDFAKEPELLLANNVLGQYSIVTSVNALHCLVEEKDRANFLKNLFLCLHPAGVMVLTTMAGPVEQSQQSKKIARCYKEPEDIRKELIQAGFDPDMKMIVEPATQHSPIPNVIFVCRKKTNMVS